MQRNNSSLDSKIVSVDRPTALFQIHGRKCLGLIDSGAARSIISENFAKKLQINIQSLETGDLKILTAINGNPLSVVGKMNLPIKINGLIIEFEFLVISEIRQNLIIGSDFCKHCQANIDYANHCFTVYGGVTGLQLLSEGSEIGTVRLTKNYILKRNVECVLPVTLSKRFVGNNTTVLIEPSVGNHKPFLVARTINKPKDNKANCRMMNLTTDDVHLRKTEIVAIFSVLSDEQVMGNIDVRHNVVSNETLEDISVPPQPQKCKYSVEELCFNLKNENVTDEQNAQLLELLKKNTDFFAKGFEDLGTTKLLEHKINLKPGVQPV